ncbi:MAG: hypothetical protein ABSF91_02085 [Bacteroidota bacterium]|jgi:hypothetical protein
MEQYREIIARNEISLSLRDKISLWWLPAFFGGMGAYIFVTSDPRIWLYRPMDFRYINLTISLLMIFSGGFFGYRAKISRRLTFVSDTSPEATKRQIISAMQNSFRWVIRREDKNYFLFYERGLWRIANESYITLVYDERGFYINCIVQTWRAGNYTSFMRTRNYVKKLKQLSSGSSAQQFS